VELHPPQLARGAATGRRHRGAPAIIAISVWMYFTLDGIAETKGINIWTFNATGEMSLLVLFVANLGFWSTMAIDIPNLTRFVRTEPGARGFVARNRNVFAGQLIALPVTQAVIAAIGAVSWIATGNWNPIEVIQGDAHGIALVALLALVVLAQWSTNNSANLIPAALTFVNAAPHLIDYRIGVALAGVIGTLCFPWAILDNLFVFLGYYGAFLSAIGGIMVADYYLIRRRRVNVPDLYRLDGQFRYWSGFNPAGLISWFVAGGFAAAQPQYAVLIGFPVGLVLYVVLMRMLVLPRHPQAEIDDGFSERFLATSRGANWIIDGNDTGPSREDR
jgi:NCS1 family nucleobase:cation symporter-1